MFGGNTRPPPPQNANFAWLQHILHHLAPNGRAGVVLANGSMTSDQRGEGDIRRAMIKADVIECMVALPGQLFYSTPIPACLWFLTKDKKKSTKCRSKEILFIDARQLGEMVDKTRKAFTKKDIEYISGTYRRWRKNNRYQDILGFCKSEKIENVLFKGGALTPSRFVGIETSKSDNTPFDESISNLSQTLAEQFSKSNKIQTKIKRNLARITKSGID